MAGRAQTLPLKTDVKVERHGRTEGLKDCENSPLCSTEFPNKPKKRKAHFDVDDDGFINDDNGFVRDGFAKNEVGGSEGDRNAPGSGDKVKTPVLGRSLYQTMSTSNDVKINSSPKAIDGQRYPCPA